MHRNRSFILIGNVYIIQCENATLSNIMMFQTEKSSDNFKDDIILSHNMMHLIIQYWLLLVLIHCKSDTALRHKFTITEGGQFYISQPATIARVTRHSIASDSNTIQCKQMKSQVFIETEFSYQVNSQDSLQGGQGSWRDQIVSATYDKATKDIWALMSQGDILKLEQSDQKDKKLKEKVRFKHKKQSGWIDGQILAFGQRIFLRQGAVIGRVKFLNSQWWFQQIEVGGAVLQVIVEGYQLYVLTFSQLFILNALGQIRNFKTQGSSLLKHFDLKGNYIYILRGVTLVIIRRYTFEIIKAIQIEEGEWSKRIRVGTNHLLIQFERHGKSVVRQFSLKEDETVEEGAIHREFRRIREILLVEDHGLVLESFDLTLFQGTFHHEKRPNFHDHPVSFKYNDLVVVEATHRSQTSLLLVGARFIELIELKNTLGRGQQIFRGMLVCKDIKVGEFMLLATFQGLCANNKGKLCKESKEYLFEVLPNSHNSFIHTLEIVFLFLITVLTVYGGIAYNYYKNRFQSEIEAQMRLIQKRNHELTQIELDVSNIEKGKEQILSYHIQQ